MQNDFERSDASSGGAHVDPNPTSRVAYWDNARGILMILVCFGHFIEPAMRKSELLTQSFTWIYSFHMPVFIWICGYMSSVPLDRDRIRQNLERLVAPYILFEFLYAFWEHWTQSTPKLTFTFATPFWPLWFLMSLFVWRILLGTVRELRFALFWLVTISVGLCASGEVSGYYWSISRTIYFFPFFYAGYLMRGQSPTRWTRSWMRWAALLCVIAGIIVLATGHIELRAQWFWGSLTTWQLGYSSPWDALRRLLVYALSATIGMLFLMLVPRRPLPWIRGWGERSLQIFLFHFAILYVATGNHWYAKLPASAWGKLGIVMAVSLTTCAVFGSKRFARWTRWLVQPPITALLQKRNPGR